MTMVTTEMATTASMTERLDDQPVDDQRRSRFRPGFRVRVLGVVAALLIGAVTVGLIVQRTVLLARLDREVQASLEQERDELERLVQGRNPATGQPFAGDVAAIFGTFLSRNVPGEGEVYITFIAGRPGPTTRPPGDVRLDQQRELVARWSELAVGESGSVDTADGPVDYIAVPLQSAGVTTGVFVVANFVRGERDEIEDGVRLEALVSAVVVLLTIGAAWIVAGRLLSPLRDVTETARTITDTDLSRRLPVDGDDEIAHLATTFNGMLQRLDTAFATQRAFIDDAGHELRTPITIVRGHLELMGDTAEDRRETVALVTDELDRMARIVDDLLLLAKSEQPDFVVVKTVELADFTTGIAARSRPLGDRRWVVDSTAQGPFDCDPDRVTQAWLNLARNAVEHTSTGSEIGIGSEQRAGHVRLWVRDTGRGIDPDERERIFDRFARGRGGPRRSDGAGLGLAIVRAVATSHGGRVELTSEVGVGSTFTIVIPHDTDPLYLDPLYLDPVYVAGSTDESERADA